MISKDKSAQLLWAELLQMLHVGQNSCKCFSYKSRQSIASSREGIFIHQATNSQSEQLVALGENSCKCSVTKQDRRQSIASSREGIITPSYKLKNQNSFTSHGTATACCAMHAVQCQYSAVRFFSTKEQVYTGIKDVICLSLMLVLSVKMMLSSRSCK